MARGSFQERRMCQQKAPENHVHVALCLNYTGTGFRGLQIQTATPTHYTVEGILIQALKDVGAIEFVENGRPGSPKHHFSRSCRTDRGVHAVRNLVSLFVHEDAFAAVGGCEGMRDKLNAVLVPAVRVARVTLVRGNFVPRNCCNRRVYRYLVPAYALLPPADSWALLERYYPSWVAGVETLVRGAHDAKEATSADMGKRSEPQPLFINLESGDAVPLPPSVAEAPEGKVAQAMMEALTASVVKCNGVLAEHFTGSNRFHNFSHDPFGSEERAMPGSASKMIHPESDEAARMVYRCEIAPRVYFLQQAGAGEMGGVTMEEFRSGCELVEGRTPSDAAVSPATPEATTSPLPSHLPFLIFQIEGASFLYNMVRKIVGSTIAVCRGASAAMLEQALSPERRVTTPLAPGPYLFLALSTYHNYDRTVAAAAGPGARQGSTVSSPSLLTDDKDTAASSSPPPPPRFPTIQSEWSGEVELLCESFAHRTIAADIVAVDLGRVPPLDELLAVRDAARRITRPQWVEEDRHLSSMKEYKPLARVADAPQRPPLTEMTRFLRALRVHNWAVKPIPLKANSKAMLEVRNKERKKAEEAALAALETVAADTGSDGGNPAGGDGASASSPAPSRGTQDAAELAEVPDGGSDGWIYVADSLEEEQAMRHAYFARRWKRSRPWEYDDGDQRDKSKSARAENGRGGVDGSGNDDADSVSGQSGNE